MSPHAAGRPAHGLDHDFHQPRDGLHAREAGSALRRSESLLQLVWERAADGMRLTDRDGTVVMANPAYCRMVGRPQEEVVGWSFADAYAPAVRGDFLAKHRVRFMAPADLPRVTRVALADGRRASFEFSHAPLDLPGEPPLLLTIIRDVTDRVRAEADARAWRTRYEAAVAATGQVLYDWEPVSGRVTWGGNCEGALGFAVAEMPLDLDGFNALVHPDDRAAFEAEAGRVAAAGDPFRMEYRVRRKDGAYVVVEDRGHFLPDGDGGRVRMVGFLADVTARVAAERAAREREELLRTIIAHIPCGVFWKDRDSVLLGCNDQFARDHGLASPAEVVGLTDRDLPFSPAEAEEHVACDRTVIESGRPVLNLEETRPRPGGGRADRLVSKVPLRDAAGGVAGVLGVYQDVTDRKTLEDRYRQAQKMEAVGRLAGGVAHDFNNLLTVINGFSEMALGRLPAGDPSRPLVEQVMKAGDRAADLTRQLLAYGRKQILHPQVLDLGALVADLGAMLHRVIGEDVELALDTAPVRVEADPGQVSQVLMNLAVNARDAMPTGGRLTVRTRPFDLDAGVAPDGARPGRYAVLEVADTGCGMTDEVKARIFEPFFTTKGLGEGTGLGLATVYGIVRQSGGHTEVESAVGRGTTFRVYLPASEPGPPRSGERAAGPRPEARGSETVLLVEDNDDVRALALHALQGAGYRVVDAAGGEQALGAVAAHGVAADLLVTDVVMPGMGGRELADRLTAVAPGLRVLYTSGYTTDAVLRHGVEHAAVHFLQKPFTPAALARKVREVLDADH
jgi:two-component system, cell cycle sensor histidine kinase and response regulator CckA